ncbi:hypothetical protein DQ657_09945 [Salmonella enterica]|nr:hypothetical protein [Salmonella enterica]
MSPETFIRQHITTALVAEGFSEIVAQGGATHGVEHYRRCSQANRKGSMYDDCLFRARQWRWGRQQRLSVKQARKSRGEVHPSGLF